MESYFGCIVVKFEIILIKGAYTSFTNGYTSNIVQCNTSEALKFAQLTSKFNSYAPQNLTILFIYHKLWKYDVSEILEIVQYFYSLNEFLCMY